MTNVSLSPVQLSAHQSVMHALSLTHVVGLTGTSGSGKSTVVQSLLETTGGALLNAKDLVDAMRLRHPLALEETFYQLVLDALAAHQIVYLDDLDQLHSLSNSCGAYPRTNYLEAPLLALVNYAHKSARKLVLVDSTCSAVRRQGFTFSIGDFTQADYEFLCRTYLGGKADRLQFDQIFRFAPKLDAHQLRASCLWHRDDDELNTNGFIDYLRSQYLSSNVDLGEVQAIKLQDLRGVDEVIRSLERNIILPLENDELAQQLALKPKRGVLLAGPPGTGKTSVGRALAHRLKSKFFLVDGTFISGTSSFYHRIDYVFEEAKRNAPSVIFIDDSDAIFESGEELGLYRYLLTMLDGLESASAGRVCVMLTAMDISHLPPALIRSGRIELWLEMRLPDGKARAEIIGRLLRSARALEGQIDIEAVAEACDGFTGADLKKMVEDGKILIAADRVDEKPERAATDYFLEASSSVRKNRELYAEAEARAIKQRSQRPAIAKKSDEF